MEDKHALHLESTKGGEVQAALDYRWGSRDTEVQSALFIVGLVQR